MRLGILLGEQTERALHAVDLVVAAVVDQTRADGIKTDDAFRTVMATEKVQAELRRRLQNLPQLEALTIWDSNGQAVNTSSFWPLAVRNALPADMPLYRQGQPGNGTYLSYPEEAGQSEDRSFFLARHVTGRDGRYIGIVGGTISSRYFSDLFNTVDPDNDVLITLRRGDGTIVALHPNSPASRSQRLPDNSRWH